MKYTVNKTNFRDFSFYELNKREGRAYFNRCRKCGKWVIDAMFNPDVLKCVECTPIEEYPNYCPECGAKTPDMGFFCHICGKRLLYGGEKDETTECS